MNKPGRTRKREAGGIREDASRLETLHLKGLGPITNLTVHPRPLTVLIGPQASGKSLVAQSLYFFRDLERLAVRKFQKGLTDKPGWQSDLLKAVLDDIRGVPFGYFANKTAVMEYSDPSGETWSLSVYWGNRRVRPSPTLSRRLSWWAAEWQSSPSTLLLTGHHGFQLFLPTERYAFSRLTNEQPSAMYLTFPTEPFRWFAWALELAGQRYAAERKEITRPDAVIDPNADPFRRQARLIAQKRRRKRWERLINICRTALRGEAYLPTAGIRQWKWRVCDRNGQPVHHPDGSDVILPLEATSSGQGEAWPIFLLAITFGGWGATFYIEEPETHLHPAAQVALLDLMMLLLEEDCRFVVTTHSPFLLYKLNNYLLAFKNSPRGRKDMPRLNPDHVAAYLLAEGKAFPLLDPETGLIDASNLEDMAAKLGEEFEELMG